MILKRYLLSGFLSGISLLQFCASTSPAAEAEKVPRIQFTTNSYGFGTLAEGEIAKFGFTFTNVGKEMLEIVDVKPGCGCTTAGQWDRRVEPGKTGTIPMQFNSTGFGGYVSKAAVVTCNDPTQPSIVLSLVGQVWRAFESSPQSLVFVINGEVQTNESKVVRIKSNLDEPVNLLQAKSSNPQLAAEILTTDPGKTFELRVTPVGMFENGTFNEKIVVSTSSSRASNLVINTFMSVQQPVTFIPKKLYIPASPLLNTFTSSIVVTYHGSGSLKLKEPRSDMPGAEFTIHEIQPGRVFKIQAVLPPGTRANSIKPPVISITTDHPVTSEINVPVYDGAQAESPSHASIGSARPVPRRSPKPKAD